MSSAGRSVLIGIACLLLLVGVHTAYTAHRRDLAEQTVHRALRLAAKGGSSARISVEVEPAESDYFSRRDPAGLRLVGSDSIGSFGLRDWEFFFSDSSGDGVRAEVHDRGDRWQVLFEVPEVPDTE